MGENTHQNCTRQNKEDPGRQQPCWGFLFCTNLTQPTGALDYKTSKEILALFESVNQNYGTTIIMITHNDAIEKMAHRIIRIKDGKAVLNTENKDRKKVAYINW